MGMGSNALMLMLMISTVLFIGGYRSTSADFLNQYVDIEGDINQTDEPNYGWSNDHVFREGGTEGDDFDLTPKESVKNNVTDLQSQGGGVFATEFLTETVIPFITGGAAILGIALATPYDFMFNLGMPPEIGLVFGTAIYMAFVLGIVIFLAGRDF